MEAFLETVLKQATELSSYVTNSSNDGIRCNKCNEKDDKKKLLRENRTRKITRHGPVIGSVLVLSSVSCPRRIRLIC